MAWFIVQVASCYLSWKIQKWALESVKRMVPGLVDITTIYQFSSQIIPISASIMIIGSCTGALLGGFQSQKFGRRKSLLFDCLVFIAATLACAMAPNFKVLLIARVILGHSVASQFTTSPVYTSEISQPEVRSVTGNFNISCFTFGVALVMMLGACLPWRYAIGSTVIVPLICFVMLLFCPESPSWLMSKGRDKEAREALKKLRGDHHTDIIDAEMFRISMNLKMMAKDYDSNDQKSSSILSLLTDSGFWKPLGVLLFVFCIGHEWTGFIAIAFYIVPLLV